MPFWLLLLWLLFSALCVYFLAKAGTTARVLESRRTTCSPGPKNSQKTINILLLVRRNDFRAQLISGCLTDQMRARLLHSSTIFVHSLILLPKIIVVALFAACGANIVCFNLYLNRIDCELRRKKKPQSVVVCVCVQVFEVGLLIKQKSISTRFGQITFSRLWVGHLFPKQGAS